MSVPGDSLPARRLLPVPPPHPALLFTVSFALGLLLYAPWLRIDFYGDDFGIIAYSSRPLVDGWFGCFRPFIGFWRPTLLLLTRLLTESFGLSPLPFHVLSVALHAAAASAAGLLALRIVPESRGIAWTAALLVVSHFAALPNVSRLCNGFDVLLGLSFLLALTTWDLWLEHPTARRGLLLAAAIVFPFTVKESAAVLPLLLFLWAWMRGRLSRRTWYVLGGTAVLSVLFLAIMWKLQLTSKGSYISAGWMKTDRAGRLVVRFFAYVAASVFPLGLVSDWPYGTPAHIPRWYRLGAALAAALFLPACVMTARARPGLRAVAVMPLLAASTLILAAPIGSGALTPRFLYSALLFVSLGAALALHTSGRRLRLIIVPLVVLVWGAGLPVFLTSSALREAQRHAQDVRRIGLEIQRLAPSWPNRALIAVYDHPHPPSGNNDARRPFCFLQLWIMSGGQDKSMLLDSVSSDTARVYRFKDGGLHEIPAGRAGEAASWD